MKRTRSTTESARSPKKSLFEPHAELTEMLSTTSWGASWRAWVIARGTRVARLAQLTRSVRTSKTAGLISQARTRFTRGLKEDASDADEISYYILLS